MKRENQMSHLIFWWYEDLYESAKCFFLEHSGGVTHQHNVRKSELFPDGQQRKLLNETGHLEVTDHQGQRFFTQI